MQKNNAAAADVICDRPELVHKICGRRVKNARKQWGSVNYEVELRMIRHGHVDMGKRESLQTAHANVLLAVSL